MAQPLWHVLSACPLVHFNATAFGAVQGDAADQGALKLQDPARGSPSRQIATGGRGLGSVDTFRPRPAM